MRRHLAVADVMTEKVLTVSSHTPFKAIASLLTEHRIGAVPVVDEDNRPIGVVSETDLLDKQRFQAREPAGWFARRRRSGRARAAGRTAAEVMTSPAFAIGPEARLAPAARAMRRHEVNRLVVTGDDGRLVGIVARIDLLRVYSVPDEILGDRVRRDVLQYALWQDPAAVRVRVDDGVVTLTGELERRSQVPIALRLTRGIDGVVDVVDELTWTVDDTSYDAGVPVQRH